MRNEKQVIDDFNRYFNKIKDETIVLYGVGKYTKLILENLSDYSVVGLMDEKQVGNTIYGKRILSEDEVLHSGCNNNIIIANLSSAQIIARRIKGFAKKNNIKVYYMNGIEIEQEDKKEEKYIAEIPKGDLYTELSLYDVISFDMFDTLVMRRCIYPEVVFRFVEKKNKRLLEFRRELL